MLEIHTISSSELHPEFNTLNLVVNGIVDEDSFVSEGLEGLEANIKNEEIKRLFQESKFQDLHNKLKTFDFYIKRDWWYGEILIECILKTENASKDDITEYYQKPFRDKNSLTAILSIDLEDWARPWSLNDLASMFESYSISLENPLIKFEKLQTGYQNGFGLVLCCEDGDNIGDKIQELLVISNEIFRKSKYDLYNSINEDHLITFFEFPAHLKTSAKQYLVYFTQFLADIGIDAETEIKEDLHNTLFTVIPKDKNQSLSKIKEALELYINAPSLNNIGLISENNDVSVMQWKANVMHLQSQMMLAQSAIQMKDATIESLQLSNYQLKEVISNHQKDNGESILDGLATIEKIKGKGFTINLPELFRRMKRKF